MSLHIAEEAVAAMVADGVRATTDPRRIVAPCVLVQPVSMVRGTLPRQGIQHTLAAYLIAPGQGDQSSWKALDTLLAQVDPHIPWRSCEPTSYSPDSGAAYPAYRLEWEVFGPLGRI